MTSDVRVDVLIGKELSVGDLETINHYRVLEFSSKNPVDPKSGNDAWTEPFFLVQVDRELVSFGTLHFLKLDFKGHSYDVLGVATIISVKKGQGYGSVLMNHIKAYIQGSRLTAIGFCDPGVSEFYMKCGLSIIKSGIKHFEFHDAYGKLIAAEHPDDDVLYVEGKDGLVSKLMNGNSENISAMRRPW